MVKTGQADSVDQAVDRAVELARRVDDRARLENRTAAYFEGRSAGAVAEERELENALSDAAQETDFGQP
jgi:hypothetical protein